MDLIPIKDDSRYMKDPNSTAILNVDYESINIAKASKKRMTEKEEEIEMLKSDVAEIKTLLLELSRKLGD